MSKGGTLPQEIITDILSRLPVKSLCRFSCVSPLWNSLISDPHFAKTHLNRTKTQNPKNLDRKIIVTSDYIYSVDFDNLNPTATKLDFPMVEKHVSGKRVRVLSSCDGLLLVSLQHNSRFFLLNPSTRECKKLPIFPFLPNQVYCFHSVYGLGYDSSTDDYKVLMLSEVDNITNGAVYSLKTNAWRRIQVPVYYINGNSGGVFFNGCIHFICMTAVRPVPNSDIIVAFDFSNEIFREMPLPASIPWYQMSYYQLVVIGSCLCLVENLGADIWMMKEYGIRDSWTKFKIGYRLDLVNMPCLLAEDEFLWATGFGKLVVYNLQKDATRDMVVCGIPNRFSFEGTYIESLVSPHQGGGIGGNE